ncbi:DgyrCDS5080 [Dimorphilus gyrociliatus]|uniref:DgyrCDS5080 n=1 Tax=Dimorphilus gyrociliatus TaxID=2664684 RepID=A0A7I8VJE1_9ANNE|nr:DgyrCDS5080 [Dimorphilus gyrociliatus]
MYRKWINIALLGLVIIATSSYSKVFVKKKVELARGSCFRLECFKGRKNGSSAYFIANTTGKGLKKRHLLIGGRLWEMHNKKDITVEEIHNMFIFNFCNLTANDSGEYVCKLFDYDHDRIRKVVNKTKIELRVVNINRKYTGKKKKKNLYIEGCRFDFTSDLPDVAKYGTVEKDKSNSRNLNYRKALDCQNNLNVKVNRKNEEVEESIKLWSSTQNL